MKSHDLSLPAWGPYSKRYAGIAHIPDAGHGFRFDIGIMPGFYRRQLIIPNVKWESGHHPWEAAPDLSHYAYRFELEWKDQVFCDVSFSAVSPQERLLRCNFVNNTALEQNLVLHLMASMNFPPVRPYSDEPIREVQVTLPPGGIWVDGLDYENLQFAVSRPTDSLVENGMLRAEIRDHDLVHGSGIGQGFGLEPGDQVSYRFQTALPLDQAVIRLRYRLDNPGPLRFKVDGIDCPEIILTGEAPDAAGFSISASAAGRMAAGEHLLRLVSSGGTGVILDGFAIAERSQASQLDFKPYHWTHKPKILPGLHPQSILLKYADIESYYGLAWGYADFDLRQILNDELDNFLRLMLHEHHHMVLSGPRPDAGHFTDIFLRPIPVPPHSEKTIWGLACAGGREEVEQRLLGFLKRPDAFTAHFRLASQKVSQPECLPGGETYRFSQERMAATELLNVVYPVYTRRQFIRHNTPGKWWDCLYTWDSGFIGLALLELDLQRAIDCLNTYVTDPGDEHAAFVYFGTPVPTQIYLFHELWNRTQDRQLLEYFYPRLRQYYLFLAGQSGSSTTRTLKSNLLRTWEYFWESGGWDDYPAQIYTNDSPLRSRITCAAITAHAIRSAKILLAAAEALGIPGDCALYTRDIDIFAEALQRFAWDEKAGTFSYVLHDADGVPLDFLRHVSGVNYNLGLDGVMPLLAGICTPAQEALLLQRLADSKHYWTRFGLSTIDQSAPYYRKDGYWNGSVWMPHQWFIWKTALDLGQGGFARQIAQTALKLWKNEVEASYYCFEHFNIQSGRGAGWHQFGGLSSPVVSWFNACYRPGRLTTGLDVWVEDQQFENHNRRFKGSLRSSGSARTKSVLLNMQPGLQYSARWNGQLIPHTELTPGSFQMEIPFTAQTGLLEFAEVDGNGNLSGN